MNEIVCWLVFAKNPEICRELKLKERVYFFEVAFGEECVYECLNRMPIEKQRIMCTHLEPSFLPDSIWNVKSKVLIYYLHSFH